MSICINMWVQSLNFIQMSLKLMYDNDTLTYRQLFLQFVKLKVTELGHGDTILYFDIKVVHANHLMIKFTCM